MTHKHSPAIFSIQGVIAVAMTTTQASAQSRFEMKPLPDLASGESYCWGLMGEVPGQYAIGRSEDGDGLRWPVVWNAGAMPAMVDDLPVPVPGFVGAEAKVISHGPSGTDYASGCAIDGLGSMHPLVWRKAPGDLDWTVEDISLYIPSSGQYEPYIVAPPGGVEMFLDTVGTTYFPGEPSWATLLFKTIDTGDWTLVSLPDTGLAYASRAESLVHAPGSGLRTIAGALETESAALIPVIWQEIAPALFLVVELPLAPGAYIGALTDIILDEDGQTMTAVGYNAIPGGIDFIRPVVYRRVAGVWSLLTTLDPLPGLRDARPTGVLARSSLSLDHLTVVGYSYFEPGSSGHLATLWEIGPDGSVWRSDLNDIVESAPPGAVLTRAEDVRWTGSPRKISIAGVYTTSSQTAGPTPTQAFMLSALPPPIPAASTWGLTVMVLLLMVAGSIVLRSSIGRTTSYARP